MSDDVNSYIERQRSWEEQHHQERMESATKAQAAHQEAEQLCKKFHEWATASRLPYTWTATQPSGLLRKPKVIRRGWRLFGWQSFVDPDSRARPFTSDLVVAEDGEFGWADGGSSFIYPSVGHHLTVKGLTNDVDRLKENIAQIVVESRSNIPWPD